MNNGRAEGGWMSKRALRLLTSQPYRIDKMILGSIDWTKGWMDGCVFDSRSAH